MKEEYIRRLDEQFAFIREIDKEKMIGRQTYISDARRKENDAEHAWHMSVMVLLLSEYANEEIDVLRTISMLLIHDIVEIDAGDTYAYDEEGKKTQAERERRAAERIYGLLPKDQGEKLYALWREFEERKTPEAKFARVMDNLQPMMLNAATDGKAWVEHGVELDQILHRNERTHEGSRELWEYALENFIKPNVEKGRISASKNKEIS
jgi:putative hydrolase of HD superfamily